MIKDIKESRHAIHPIIDYYGKPLDNADLEYNRQVESDRSIIEN